MGGEEREENEGENTPAPSKEAAELNTVWFLFLRGFAQQPNPDSRCSIPSSDCEHRNSVSLLFFLPCQKFLGGECQWLELFLKARGEACRAKLGRGRLFAEQS